MPSVKSENIKSVVTSDEWNRLKLKYQTYYGKVDNVEERLNKIKILVLADASRIGMNYLDYSQYQGRTQVIMKPTLTKEQENKILHSYFIAVILNYSFF